MKKIISLFLTLTASFVLVACSSGSGSGSQGEANSTNNSYSGEKRTIIIPTVDTISDLTTEEGIAKLQATIKEQSNLVAGTCSNSSSSICSSKTAEGTVLGSYEQSYSSYAVIRSAYDADGDGEKDDENKPSNAYVALVTTPTTNANSVVDATYTGIVSYSRQNSPTIVSRDTLTMTVKDNQISGVVTQTTGSGVTSNTMTFESANIVAGSESITFSGDVTFRQGSFYTSDEYEGDIQGTYQGVFAGSNAEEVIGTFHSNNTEKLTSVQGAFAASK